MRVVNVFQFATNGGSGHTSNELMLSDGHQLAIQISGDFSSCEIELQGKVDSYGDWVKVSGVDLSNLEVVENIEKTGIYIFDITGLLVVRTKITNISGGTAQIFGRLVAI